MLCAKYTQVYRADMNFKQVLQQLIYQTALMSLEHTDMKKEKQHTINIMMGQGNDDDVNSTPGSGRVSSRKSPRVLNVKRKIIFLRFDSICC